MKVGLIIVLGLLGLFLLGPIGLICGILIGCTASIVGSNSASAPPVKSNDPLLDSAMRKIREEGEARRAARRQNNAD